MTAAHRSLNARLAEKLGVSVNTIKFMRSQPEGDKGIETALLMKAQSEARTKAEYLAIGKRIRKQKF